MRARGREAGAPSKSLWARLSDRALVGAYRIGKRRLRPFCADPRAMTRLRDELLRRGYARLVETAGRGT